MSMNTSSVAGIWVANQSVETMGRIDRAIFANPLAQRTVSNFGGLEGVVILPRSTGPKPGPS
jgi:hypothetical protein